MENTQTKLVEFVEQLSRQGSIPSVSTILKISPLWEILIYGNGEIESRKCDGTEAVLRQIQ